MGFLDDAIREHLDLKRRRGADPGEIERLEREALGPVRRGAREVRQPMAEGEEQATAYLDLERRPADPGEIERLEREAAADQWSEPLDERAFPDDRSEEDYDDAEGWEVPQREPLGGVGVEPEAAPAPAVPPPGAETTPGREPVGDDELVDQETVEHDVEAEHAAEQAGHSEEEDMLEETPEFLQDTPDHDRLWFEQRPPRDFDLDG